MRYELYWTTMIVVSVYSLSDSGNILYYGFKAWSESVESIKETTFV